MPLTHSAPISEVLGCSNGFISSWEAAPDAVVAKVKLPADTAALYPSSEIGVMLCSALARRSVRRASFGKKSSSECCQCCSKATENEAEE